MSIETDTFPHPLPKLVSNPKLTMSDWEGHRLTVREGNQVVEFQIYTTNGKAVGLVFDMAYADVKRLREVLTYIMEESTKGE